MLSFQAYTRLRDIPLSSPVPATTPFWVPKSGRATILVVPIAALISSINFCCWADVALIVSDTFWELCCLSSFISSSCLLLGFSCFLCTISKWSTIATRSPALINIGRYLSRALLGKPITCVPFFCIVKSMPRYFEAFTASSLYDS